MQLCIACMYACMHVSLKLHMCICAYVHILHIRICASMHAIPDARSIWKSAVLKANLEGKEALWKDMVTDSDEKGVASGTTVWVFLSC